MKADTSEKICSVSFDVWGTLIDLNSFLNQIADYTSKMRGVAREELYKRVLEAYETSKSLRRRFPQVKPLDLLKKSRSIMAEALGVSQGDVENLIVEAVSKADVRSWVYDDVSPALEALKGKGFRLGVIGNVLFWSSDLTMHILNKVDLSAFFDAFAFADKLGFSKPDREIFLKYSEIIGCEPEKILHVGDNIVEDVGGPLSAGFYAVLIKRGSSERLIIRELHTAIIKDMRELPEVITRL